MMKDASEAIRRVENLLEQRAKIHERSGVTPLQKALMTNEVPEVIKLLLEKGEDANTRSRFNNRL